MRSPPRFLWVLPLVFLASICAIHLRAQTTGAPSPAPAPPVAAATAAFVGSARCAVCHRREFDAWHASQHARALQAARAGTVAGKFNNATFEKDGVRTSFLTRDGRFLIDTVGPDGKPGEFEVKFTLGLEPLQQYLVELPGGRLQAFGIAWDTRPAAAGGQRWFDLYPGQKLAPGNPLHWTGIQQTANFMCIDCHVANFRKGFDEQANAYHSTWSEAGVGCEACHGPGAAHATSPQKVKLPARYLARSRIAWGTDPKARPEVPAEARTAELQTCARCHARRAQLTDDIHASQPFADGFHGSLLVHGLYHADGQMQDEVYNWGSFLQSRMFSKGVSCSDCHDPHSGKLRVSGNAVCEQCHEAAKFDSRAHHFHDPASKAGQCATCHMPAVTYMIVDPRHDHSFRVPRPDLARSLDAPDVCASCHGDKPAGWTAEELKKRLGRDPAGFQTFAEAFDAADRGAPGAEGLLARIANDAGQPAIVRASALARAEAGAAGINLGNALADPDPLVRRSAVELAGSGDIAPWIAPVARLLQDPLRDVRIEAARALAGPAEPRLNAEQRAAFRKAIDEYIAVQRYNADRGEAHMNLALLEIRRGNGLLADDHLARAMEVDPTFVPAYLQQADLYRARGNEARAEQTLRQAIARNPDAAEAHYALGLSLVRQHRAEAALAELARAAELGPATARFGYAYAVALDQSGDRARALQILDGVLGAHPYDVEALAAGAIWAMRRGDSAAALRYLAKLQSLRPDDPGIRQQIEKLQRGAPPPR